jgi:hypothetical protein
MWDFACVELICPNEIDKSAQLFYLLSSVWTRILSSRIFCGLDSEDLQTQDMEFPIKDVSIDNIKVCVWMFELCSHYTPFKSKKFKWKAFEFTVLRPEMFGLQAVQIK